MVLFRDVIEVSTEKGISYVDITETVSKLVGECQILEGLCNIFIPSSTAGLMVNDGDRMLIEDFRRHFAAIDETKIYSQRNAFSQLRANLLDAEKTLPVSKGRLLLDGRQSILLWEFDKEPRKREIIITVSGE